MGRGGDEQDAAQEGREHQDEDSALDGHPDELLSDEAPATGYGNELTIDRKRLQEMRRASADRIMEGKEYFFFRLNKHYGKGEISWTSRLGKGATSAGELRFSYRLWMQREVNDPTLTLRK